MAEAGEVVRFASSVGGVSDHGCFGGRGKVCTTRVTGEGADIELHAVEGDARDHFGGDDAVVEVTKEDDAHVRGAFLAADTEDDSVVF